MNSLVMIKNKTVKTLYFWILIICLLNISYFLKISDFPVVQSLEDFKGLLILFVFLICGPLWPLAINFIFISKFKKSLILINSFTFLYGISYVYIHCENYLNPSNDPFVMIGLVFFGTYITQFLSIIWVIIFIREKNIISKLKERSFNKASSYSGMNTNTAKLIYIIYLVALLIPFISLIGVIMAYINKGKSLDWLDENYRFQIRTFWISLLLLFSACLIGLVDLFIAGGVVFLIVIWCLMRCIKGLKALNENRVPDKVDGWWF